jgi:peroxiredoxin
MKRHHNRFFTWFATVAACFVMAAAAASLIRAASAQEGALKTLVTPLAAPQGVYYDADGKSFALQDLKGKVVIVHFWAKWCPPCIIELPEMRKALDAIDNKDLVILPLSLDQNPGTVELFYQENAVSFPVLMDRKGELSRAFEMKALPMTVLLNRKGEIVARRDGVADWDAIPTRAMIEGELKN